MRPSRSHFARVVIAIALVTAPLSLGAQTPAPSAARPLASLRTGDTLRVWGRTPAEDIGVLASLSDDTLALRRFDGRDVALPVVSLSHVDVQHGRRTSAARVIVGILLGGAAGGIIGGYAGAGLECANGCEGDFGGLAGGLAGGALGIVVGAITGGVIGGQMKVRRWRQVYP